MYTKQIYLGIFMFLFTCLATNIDAQGVSVNNGRLFFKGVPGEREVQEITLTNPTNEKVLFQLSFQDWVRDTFGVKQYSDPNTLNHSCASWASVSETSVELPPRGEKTVTVEMAPPRNVTAANGVHNAMLFIRQIKDPYARVTTNGNLQSSINATFQIGVHLYYIHPSLQSQELAIKGFQYEDQDDKENLKFMIKLENVGETVVDGNIKLELTNADSGKEYRPFDKHPVAAAFMPNDVRYVTIDLPDDIPAGKYSALAIVDIGAAHDLQMAVIDVEIRRER
jgi:hypothetical protein